MEGHWEVKKEEEKKEGKRGEVEDEEEDSGLEKGRLVIRDQVNCSISSFSCRP